MVRTACLLLGLAAYAVFFAAFLYLVAFVGNLPLVPVTIDRGPPAATGTAALVDLALVALFGLQHSVMARPAFKAAWTRVVPPVLERSIYVAGSSAALVVLFAFWRPLPAPVWSVGNPALVTALWVVFALGWVTVLLSTFLISHFQLFGLAQVWSHFRGRGMAPKPFMTPALYRYVRHPLYLGFLVAFWATPAMTAGHLLFAAAMTGYMLVAIRFEEHDLVAHFGDRYADYRNRVGMLLPRLR